MRHLSITIKFLTLLGSMGLFVLCAVAYSSFQMVSIDKQYQGLLQGEETAVINLARANRSLQTARAAISDMLMSRSDAANRSAMAELDTARQSFVKFIDTAIAALPGNEELQPIKIRGLRIIDETCRLSVQKALVATASEEVLASQAEFLTQCQPQFPEVSKASVEVAQKLIGDVDAKDDAAEAAAVSAIWSTVASILAGLSIFLLLGLAGVRKWLAAPVRDLSEAMRRLADADYSTEVTERDRRDEIGAMARAVQVFKENGQRGLELEREADETRSRTEDERRRNAETERRRAEEMSTATQSLGSGLKHLAGGDLTFTLDTPFASDFEGLRTDFNSAVCQLAETLFAVSQATAAIDAGSQEVSRSADDLSKRTEQQAASLEETAAALDQITANVSNSSRRADEARSVAAEAEGSAEHSAEVVAKAVDAIEKIEGSSRQISSIIGVIDDIAFQTNLLALNAGVEAARAGEAGKGFAVVAQEVRELAQRSANAAREIKDLIRTSETEVVNGVALVRETGGALETIQKHVAKINQHMDSIAISAKEQSVGLTQVNTAVNEMDQVTQKNAAMVEETNAASATLAGESGKLRSLISAFQLPHAITGHQSDQAFRSVGNISILRPSPGRAAAAAQALADWEEF
ncbi:MULTISPECIES: methyl-accepting chemotaxis protein [unclassified Rhizobium]|uniref:methyl-accepting chemotaxis protein n=1 Tax=unclassified Rhizobium TaxID=2613769 RepID=UPI001ADBDF32|nr:MULTISPECIES: methyl-accepting chemotaxis protein [unclassified Rhizobium]MBO9127012.1 HAMP domain-containing protein [Rhizobium sp. 16-488-2b]MBO9177459.1 HAMP domain-containing protein [Rhizobium sp. 16-488-2a]